MKGNLSSFNEFWWDDVNNIFKLQSETWSWLGRDSLNVLLLLISSLVGESNLIVDLTSFQEVLTTLALHDVFHSNMESLLDDSVSDLLVDFNTDSSWCNVPDSTSLTVVDSVWHTSMFIRVDLNSNVITELEVGQEELGGQDTVVSESSGEGVSGSSTITE